MMSKRVFIVFVYLLFFSSALFAQQVANPPDIAVRMDNTEKREMKKNLVIKEWNTDAAGKRVWIDRMTTYNSDGYKIEEIEYARYGQKYRNTFERNILNQCVVERNYDNKNKLQRVIKYTYSLEGIKQVQYNYLPNGKLFSTKRFDYIEVDSK